MGSLPPTQSNWIESGANSKYLLSEFVTLGTIGLHRVFSIFKKPSLFYVFEYLIVCMCTVCPQKSEGVDFPGNGVTGSYEPPHGCWELNPGPLKSNQCS